MILIGMGYTLAIIPFNSIFFRQTFGRIKYSGTVGFIMYVADSFGYLASVGVVLFREFGYSNIGWLSSLFREVFCQELAHC